MLSWPATTTANRDRWTTRPSRRREPDMNNQHPWLSQVLAQQRITEQRQQATHARVWGRQSPVGSSAPVEGGAWLVAAGPVASLRRPAVSRRPHSVN